MPTLYADVFATATPGLTFTVDPQTWRIAPNVVVTAIGQYGVHSPLAHSTLINNGHILAPEGPIGVYFAADRGVITNAATGTITAADYAIAVGGNFETINNLGTIIGTDGIGVKYASGSNHVVLNNSGFIYGKNYGVHAESVYEGSVLHNSGLIKSGGYGFTIAVSAGLVATIDNQANGIIKGTLASIYGFFGGLFLDNDGTLTGAIDLNGPAQRDVIVNHGKIKGAVLLGPGNDLFKGQGGTSGPVFGEDGNDRIVGGDKVDRINGGLGKDTTTGKLGADFFDFDSSLDSVVGALRDRITDFSHAQHDRIDLAGIDANALMLFDQAFAFRGTQAFTGVAQLRYVKMNLPGTANDKTIVSGNVNFDLAPDFQIELKGLHNLVAGDFIL